MHQLGCLELSKIILNFQNNALAAPERDRLERHLAECGNCRSVVRSLESLSCFLEMPEPEPMLLSQFMRSLRCM